MVGVMLPAGFFAGEFYTEATAEDPEYYEVRLGREILRLDPVTYGVWAMAHGNPEQLAAGAEPSRFTLAEAARESGLDDVGQQVADLQELGLLVQVLPVGAQLQRFAESHVVKPLALGLGNAAEDMTRIRIGPPEDFRIAIPPVAYNVWLYGDQYESLWGTCEQVAKASSANQTVATPDTVLNEVLAVLPLMIAVSCAYIDRR